jgi:hypothetical protein
MPDDKKNTRPEPTPPVPSPDDLSPADERRKVARQRDGEERGDVIAENISNP